MIDWSPARVAAQISSYSAGDPLRVPGGRESAVAAILRWTGEAPEILLMERAHRENDRWSGQVSMPGGRREPDDADLEATAIRETREELGIDLNRSARRIGRLDGVRAIARGKIIPMTITPFVFVQTEPLEPVLGDEAREAFWLPLGPAAQGALHFDFEYPFAGVSMRFPSWKWENHVVWGLTFQMLQGLVKVVGR